jgi:hypothetical protein
MRCNIAARFFYIGFLLCMSCAGYILPVRSLDSCALIAFSQARAMGLRNTGKKTRNIKGAKPNQEGLA